MDSSLSFISLTTYELDQHLGAPNEYINFCAHLGFFWSITPKIRTTYLSYFALYQPITTYELDQHLGAPK